MKRTSFFADEQLTDELKKIAREERKTLASVVREATARQVREQRRRKKRQDLSASSSTPVPQAPRRFPTARSGTTLQA